MVSARSQLYALGQAASGLWAVREAELCTARFTRVAGMEQCDT